MGRRQLVLASASPRRSEILHSLDLEFLVEPADVDESLVPGETPAAYVERLARDKARAVTAHDRVVVAADTVVVLDGAILTKPADREGAKIMLRRLAGREHKVLTAIAIRTDTEPTEVSLNHTAVTLAPMTDVEIDWYVGTGEPLDKAGSYAIQGLGALIVEHVDGNYSNVVGLPVPALYRLFEKLGLSLLDFRKSRS